MGLELTKTCKACGRKLKEEREFCRDMVFLECPRCRVIWDYYYKDGRPKCGERK